MPQSAIPSSPPGGLRVSRIEASFFADGTLSHWRDVAESLGMELGETDSDECVFTALPGDLERGKFYLSGGFHPSGQTPAESTAVHWHLCWALVPDEEPPAELRESSDAVGGYPRILTKLVEAWPESSEISVRFSVRFTASPSAKGSSAESITVRGRFHGNLSADLPRHLERAAWDGLIHTVGS